nr:hypothetical protein [Tanacetum cinerariifolium]
MGTKGASFRTCFCEQIFPMQ